MAVSISRSVAPLIARRWRSTSRRRSSRVRRRNGPHCASLRSAVSSFDSALSRVLDSARLLLLEEPPLHPLLWREVGPFDLRPRVVSWARGQRALVDGELFDRGLLECSAEARERVAVVEVVEVAFVFARRAGDVETGPRAGPGERDVTPLCKRASPAPRTKARSTVRPWADARPQRTPARPYHRSKNPALITRLSHALAAAVTPERRDCPTTESTFSGNVVPASRSALSGSELVGPFDRLSMGQVRPPLVCRGGVGRVGHRS